MWLKSASWQVACAIACSMAVPCSGTAQESGTGGIRGFVLTGRDSSPVPFATVTLDSSGVAVTTDSAGAFAFRTVQTGRHVLYVRKVGFAPVAVPTLVEHDVVKPIEVRLDATVQILPQVEVRGRKVIDLPRFTAAVERADRNNGAVFTADDIVKQNPLETKSLLEQVPGVHVNDRGVTFVRCQDSGTLSTSRSTRSRGAPGIAGTDAARRSARVQVYVDGTRMTRYLDAPVADDAAFDPNADFNVNGILKDINPRSIAVMEVYTGVAKIPAEFLEDACAVIAIWTKAY